MLAAQHGNPDVRVAPRRHLGTDALHLVSENNAHRKGRYPFKQIDGVRCGFDCCNLVPSLAQSIEHRQRELRAQIADAERRGEMEETLRLTQEKNYLERILQEVLA